MWESADRGVEDVDGFFRFFFRHPAEAHAGCVQRIFGGIMDQTVGEDDAFFF